MPNDVAKLKQAGFTDSEIDEYYRPTLRQAGFSDDEINNYLGGTPQVDPQVAHNQEFVPGYEPPVPEEKGVLQRADEALATALDTEKMGTGTSALYGVGETVAGIGTGIVDLIATGYGALATYAETGDWDAAARHMEEQSGTWKYDPKTEVGKTLEAVAMKPVEWLHTFWNKFGEYQVYDPDKAQDMDYEGVADLPGFVPPGVAAMMAATGELVSFEAGGVLARSGAKAVKGKVKPAKPTIAAKEWAEAGEIIRQQDLADKVVETAEQVALEERQPKGSIGQKLAEVERKAKDIIEKREEAKLEAKADELIDNQPQRQAHPGAAKGTELPEGGGKVVDVGRFKAERAVEQAVKRSFFDDTPQQVRREPAHPGATRTPGPEPTGFDTGGEPGVGAPESVTTDVTPTTEVGAGDQMIGQVQELQQRFLSTREPVGADTSGDMGKLGRRNLGGEKLPAREVVEVVDTGQGKATENLSGKGKGFSEEAKRRAEVEEAKGQHRWRVKKNGEVIPLKGVDAVDAVANKGEVIIQEGVAKGDAPAVLSVGDGANVQRAVKDFETRGEKPKAAEPLKTKADAVIEIEEPAAGIDLSTFTFEELETQFNKMMEQGRDKSDPMYKAVHDEIHTRAKAERAKIEAQEKKASEAAEKPKAKAKSEKAAPVLDKSDIPITLGELAEITGADLGAKPKPKKPVTKAKTKTEPLKTQKEINTKIEEMGLDEFEHEHNPQKVGAKMIKELTDQGMDYKLAKTRVTPKVEKYEKNYRKVVDKKLAERAKEQRLAEEAKAGEKALKEKAAKPEKPKPKKPKQEEVKPDEFDTVNVEMDAEAQEILKEMKGERKGVELKEDVPKSEGHEMFVGHWEYFKLPNGKLYRAPRSNPLNSSGWRKGAKWVASGEDVAGAIEIAKNMKSRGVKPGQERPKPKVEEPKAEAPKTDEQLLAEAAADIPEVRTVSLEALKSKEMRRFLEIIEDKTDWSGVSKAEMLEHIKQNYSDGRFLDVHKDMYEHMRGRTPGTKPYEKMAKGSQAEVKFYSGLPMDMVYEDIIAGVKKAKAIQEKWTAEKAAKVKDTVGRLAEDIWGEKHNLELRQVAKQLGIKKPIEKFSLKELRQVENVLENLKDRIEVSDVHEALKTANEITSNAYRSFGNETMVEKNWRVSMLETPIRIFEELGRQTKEFFYDRMVEADKLAGHEKKALLKEFKKVTKGLRKKSEARITQYAISKQKGGMKILKDMGIEPPKFSDLSAKEQAAYNWMRKELENFHKVVNEVRVKAGLEPFGKTENYFTFWHKYTSLLESGMSVHEFSAKKIAGETPFRFKKRLFRKDGLWLEGFEIFRNYAEAAYQQKHITPLVVEWNKALKSNKFAQVKPNAHGFLSQWVNSASGMPVQTNYPGVARVARVLNENVAAAVLAYNVRSMMIQPTAFAGAYSYLGGKWLIEAAYDLASHPLETHRHIRKNSNLVVREFDAHVRDVMSTTTRWKRKAAKAGLKPLQMLDMATAEVVWQAAYKKAAKKYGMNEAKAIRFADDAVVKTQASARPYDLSPIQRTTVGKFATLFQTFVINQWDYLLKDMLGIGGKKIAKTEIAARTLRWLVAVNVVNMIFEDLMGINSPFPTPYKKFKQEKEKDKTNTRAGVRAAAEVLDVIPFMSSFRYGSTPLGAGAGVLQDFSDIVADKKGPTRPVAEIAGKVVGVPGTMQASKYVKRKKWGYSTPAAILGSGKGKPKKSKVFGTTRKRGGRSRSR